MSGAIDTLDALIAHLDGGGVITVTRWIDEEGYDHERWFDPASNREVDAGAALLARTHRLLAPRQDGLFNFTSQSFERAKPGNVR